MTAISRLDDLFRHMQVTLNRDIHSLVWSRKSGKDQSDEATFGLLCLRPYLALDAPSSSFQKHVNRLLPFHHLLLGFPACSPRRTTNRQFPAALPAVTTHSPPEGMLSLPMLVGASGANRQPTVSHPADAHVLAVSPVNSRARRIRHKASHRSPPEDVDAHDTAIRVSMPGS